MPANGLIRGDLKPRGMGWLPSATRARSGPQAASHGLVFVVYVGDEAGAIPSPPRRRARTAKPRHYRPEIHHRRFRPRLTKQLEADRLLSHLTTGGGRLVIESDNRTAGRYPLHRLDLDHRGIANASPRREKRSYQGAAIIGFMASTHTKGASWQA